MKNANFQNDSSIARDLKSTVPRRCFTIMRQDLSGDFCGLIRMEDHRSYSVGISACAGERFLKVWFTARTQSSMDDIGGRRLFRFASRHYAILQRAPKTAERNSDYIGDLSLECGHRYRVGIRFLVSPLGEQELSLFALPLHLNLTEQALLRRS